MELTSVVYVLILVLCFQGASKYGGAITWFWFELIWTGFEHCRKVINCFFLVQKVYFSWTCCAYRFLINYF